MNVNLEKWIKAQAMAQPATHHPDFRPYRLVMVKREVVSRFARAYRRSFYEGELSVAEATTPNRVTVWSLSNRCPIVLPATDVMFVTEQMVAGRIPQ